MQRRHFLWATLGSGFSFCGWAQSFDHRHSAWTALLKKHVQLQQGGQASALNYSGMAADRAELKAYLQTLSSVSNRSFQLWSKPQQQAFLINAYNAFTVELVLSRYPKLKSIKDLGNLLSSPWSLRWITLLESTVTLDDIEHSMLRKPKVYDDPRVHFAVNCASVGCPMLREEAYTFDRIHEQLNQQAQRFMADRTRNRWNASKGRLEVSKIFDWYGDDFRQGHQGIVSLQAFMAQHAERLADTPAQREALRSANVKIDFLSYDWALNDVRGAS